MNFVNATHNSDVWYDMNYKFGGTSLSGYVTTTYDTLVELFGEPNDGDGGYKVHAEWNLIVLVNGTPTPVAIYNWKDDRVPKDEYDWHIGGPFGGNHDFDVVGVISDMIDENFAVEVENVSQLMGDVEDTPVEVRVVISNEDGEVYENFVVAPHKQKLNDDIKLSKEIRNVLEHRFEVQES